VADQQVKTYLEDALIYQDDGEPSDRTAERRLLVRHAEHLLDLLPALPGRTPRADPALPRIGAPFA
jgi:hypothetical protein